MRERGREGEKSFIQITFVRVVFRLSELMTNNVTHVSVNDDAEQKKTHEREPKLNL